MKENRTEGFDSPLEALLSEKPHDEPPADLKRRCLQAVYEAERAYDPRRAPVWPILWKGALSLAAAFAVMVLVTAIIPRPAKTGRASDRVARLAEPAPPPAAEAAASPVLDRVHRANVNLRDTVRVTEGPANRFAQRPDFAREQPGHIGPGDGGPAASPPMGNVDVEPRPTRAPSYPRAELEEQYYTPIGPPERPWRDESGERQKVARKEMKLEVRDVDDAHERAVSIIISAKGYVENEEMQINERGEGESVINARVPVDALEGVVSRLKELGKVIELRGESEDRTDEYYSGGQNIRNLAEEEMRLVDLYEKEENPTRKRVLLSQIQSIRRQIREQKVPLKALARDTHFAYLTLTLTQATGPWQFLHRMGQSVPVAAAWLGVSAIFWLPALLIVLLIWRKVAFRSE